MSSRTLSLKHIYEFSEYLQQEEKGYEVRSINSMLTSVNQFLAYLGWCKNVRRTAGPLNNNICRA